MKSFAASL
ncbi:hypothetical protein LINGRAHAP2_LOCUS27761 [Linum grandiflorum]